MSKLNDKVAPITGGKPAATLEARIASIDLNETAATVRLELDDWTGLRFTRLVHAPQS